jgi:hypothetical protein
MKAKEVLIWVVIVAVLAMLVAGFLLLAGVVKFSTASSGGDTGANTQLPSGCNLYGNAQTFTIASVDYVNTGTSVTSTFFGKYNSGYETPSHTASATGVTDSGLSSYDLLVNASGYYGARTTGTTKCVTPDFASVKLGRHGTLLSTVYDKYTQVTAAACIALTTDSPIDVSVETYVNQTDRVFSNPDDQGFMKLAFDLNASCWDTASITVSDGTLDTLDSFLAGTYEVAYKIPKTLINNKGTHYIKTGADTTSGEAKLTSIIHIAPLSGYDCSDQNVTVRFVDSDYYTHTKTREILFGSSNDVGADVGNTTTTAAVIYVK